jgi:hypothetical protein
MVTRGVDGLELVLVGYPRGIGLKLDEHNNIDLLSVTA